MFCVIRRDMLILLFAVCYPISSFRRLGRRCAVSLLAMLGGRAFTYRVNLVILSINKHDVVSRGRSRNKKTLIKTIVLHFMQQTLERI
jgi:hypothetical protein